MTRDAFEILGDDLAILLAPDRGHVSVEVTVRVDSAGRVERFRATLGPPEARWLSKRLRTFATEAEALDDIQEVE